MSWFPNWVETYRVATGADQRTVAALLADEWIVLERWQATPEELGEVATRLVARCQVPNFASEHLGALGRGLIALRDERKAAKHAAQYRGNGHEHDCDCPLCFGGGGSPRWQAARARLAAALAGVGLVPPRRGR